MIIGVPREVKDWEGRVAMTPAGVRQATASGHTVLVETTAGEASAVTDEEYRAAGERSYPRPMRCGSARR